MGCGGSQAVNGAGLRTLWRRPSWVRNGISHENPTPRMPTYFYMLPFSIMHKVLRLLQHAGKLKEIERKGWKRAGVEKPESVACHSYRVAFLAMLTGDILGMDTEKMIKMALLHDLAEAIIGDITPYEMEREEKERKEEKVMKELLDGFDEYYRLWREYMEGKSEEAKIVQEIDKLEMILQAHEYASVYEKEKLMEFFEEEGNIKHPMLVSILKSL